MALLPPLTRKRWNGSLANRLRLRCDNPACGVEFFRESGRRRGAHDFCSLACLGTFRRRSADVEKPEGK